MILDARESGVTAVARKNQRTLLPSIQDLVMDALFQFARHGHVHFWVLDVVDAFLATEPPPIPAVWGVFYYRTANRRTLNRLARFFEVPVDNILGDFEQGHSAAEICAMSIAALARRGVKNVYVSNLHPERAPRQLKAIHRALADMGVDTDHG